MLTFLLAFLFIAFMIGAMAIGVILKGKPIKGSCGGMAAMNMETACDICGGDTKKCDEEQERLAKVSSAAGLAYDAASRK